MKKLFIFFTLLTACFVKTTATIRTVCNVPTNLAQFNTIQAAVDASSGGDSIYVIGSPNVYDAFNITDKRLAVFGAGWAPDKQLPLTSVINGCVLVGASSGCEFQGLTIVSNININTPGVNDLKFIRNRFSNMSFNIFPSPTGSMSGYVFEGNWFDNSNILTSSSYSFTNFLFHNNVFYENGCCVAGSIGGFSNSVNILFDHNLWYGPNGSTRDCFENNCRFLTLSNNIFIKRSAASNNSFSTFNNNLTFLTGDDTAWIKNNNVDGGGNIAGKSPQMADESDIESGIGTLLSNFTIASGPANNTGSDGKDIGLLFDGTGSLNWANSRQGRLPYVFSMNVTTPTVLAGGTVSVSVEGRKND